MGWDGGNNAWYDVTDVITPTRNLPLNGSLPYSTPNDYAYVDGVTVGGNGDLRDPLQDGCERTVRRQQQRRPLAEDWPIYWQHGAVTKQTHDDQQLLGCGHR